MSGTCVGMKSHYREQVVLNARLGKNNIDKRFIDLIMGYPSYPRRYPKIYVHTK